MAEGRHRASSKTVSDAKFAAKAASTGGRSAVGAVGKDAAQRASTGGAAKPSNVLPRRPSDLGEGSSFKRPGSGGKSSPGKTSDKKLSLPSGKRPSQTLVAEFLICFIILGAGTIVAPQGSKDGIPRLMARGTGLCILFLILALVASANEKAAKAAAGLGALVTVTYLFTSSDATNVFSWASKFFSREGVLTSAGTGADAGAAAGAPGPAGAVGDVIGTTAGEIGTAFGGGLGGDAGAAAGAAPPTSIQVYGGRQLL